MISTLTDISIDVATQTDENYQQRRSVVIPIPTEDTSTIPKRKKSKGRTRIAASKSECCTGL